MEIKAFPRRVNDNGGRILYYTRLWDPAKSEDNLEKQRRQRMNEFRINAVKILKKYYPNSFVGLYPCPLAIQMAPELVLGRKETFKKHYMAILKYSDICIVDDGLKDTLGWKIGENVIFGKSIITTPIQVIVPKFNKNVNYLELKTRDSFEELPHYIEELQKGKRYLEIGINNFDYGQKYLYPMNYFE
jgi:hypothetical protein